MEQPWALKWPLLCQQLHGPAGSEDPGSCHRQAPHLVMLHRQYLCHLEPWRGGIVAVCGGTQLHTSHHQVHSRVVWSRENIPFLDTLVSLKDGAITTDLYVKPTDTHQYLAANSCHPRHCKEAIPFSQALRMRRICSSDGDFLKRTAELKSHLTRRGYSPSFIQGQIDRASSIRRADALAPGLREANRRVPLVVTYHPSLPNLPTITRDNTPVLHASQRLKNAIPESPIIAYRRPKNLRDLLVSSHLKPPSFEPARGSSPCGSRRCLTCDHVQTGTTIRSTTAGVCYHTRATATCKSSNIIYLIECRQCHKQYICG